MQLLLAKNNQSFLHLSSNFSLYLLSFQYFFVSLPCRFASKGQAADILKKRRCTNALSTVIRISQIPTLLYDKAMANAHVFGIYILYI